MKREEFLKEVRGLTPADARQKARQLAEELMRLRFKGSGGQYEGAGRIRTLKRNVARALTIALQGERKSAVKEQEKAAE